MLKAASNSSVITDVAPSPGPAEHGVETPAVDAIVSPTLVGPPFFTVDATNERGEILLQRLVDGPTSPESRRTLGQAYAASASPVSPDGRTGKSLQARTREQSNALLRMQLELPQLVTHKVC